MTEADMKSAITGNVFFLVCEAYPMRSRRAFPEIRECESVNPTMAGVPLRNTTTTAYEEDLFRMPYPRTDDQ